jgi:hypothetical protein
MLSETKKLLDENQVAVMLNVAVQTLRNWRHERRGLPYCKISRAVRYREADVVEFINNKRIVFEN